MSIKVVRVVESSGYLSLESLLDECVSNLSKTNHLILFEIGLHKKTSYLQRVMKDLNIDTDKDIIEGISTISLWGSFYFQSCPTEEFLIKTLKHEIQRNQLDYIIILE